jgi:hypothetical protein
MNCIKIYKIDIFFNHKSENMIIQNCTTNLIPRALGMEDRYFDKLSTGDGSGGTLVFPSRF